MKNYVEFYFPGVSDKGHNERECPSRKVETVPDFAIAYRFFNKDEKDNKVNYSPYHYIGKEYSIEEFKKKYPQLANCDFISNAQRIVQTRTAGFYPILAEDIVVTF